MSHDIVLGLGSNLGRRLQWLNKALDRIQMQVGDIKAVSSIYESPAMLKPNAPDSWNKPFLNMAVRCTTQLEANALLQSTQAIEKKLERKKHDVWSPRTIDIDILIFNEEYISEDNITIPHKGLLERDFMLIPLCEVSPESVYPAPGKMQGKTINSIASSLFAAHSLKLYQP